MVTIHACVKFSEPFELADIEERWYQLMYDETLSRLAKKRFAELQPEEVLRIQVQT